jgi:hypothetical protein
MAEFDNGETFRLPTKKTLYAVFDGHGDTLRAFRILDAYYGRFTAFHIQIAGVGKAYIFSDYLHPYESKEDYLNNKLTNAYARDGEYDCNEFDVEDMLYGYCSLTKEYVFNCMKARPIIYAWIGNKVKRGSCLVTIKYFVMQNDFDVSCRVIEKGFDGVGYYITEEDCIADNEVDVCDFDEPSQREYEVEVEVIKTIKTRVRSTSVESVVKNAKVAFDKVENFKVFVDGELQYESK